MKLSEHVQPVNWKTVSLHMVGALGLLGILMIPPFTVSLFYGKPIFWIIFGSLAAGLSITGLVIWNYFKTLTKLQLVDAIVITALVYLLYSLLGAIPFLPVKPFLDAFFEAMSGFTTTGLTMINESAISHTLHFYRAYTQWLGGMGIIVLSLAILLRPGKAAFKLYSTEFGEENILGSVEATAKAVIQVYLLLTAVGFVAFLLAGMSPFDSLIHILTTIPTGGFSNYPASIGYFNSPVISLTVCVFMMLGAFSFPLYYLSVSENSLRFVKDEQVQGLVLITLIGSLIFIISFGATIQSIVPGIFQTVTSITTTGFSTVSSADLSDGEKLTTSVLMIIGGSTGSTAGGIKIFRLLILLAFVRVAFFRTLLPREAKIPLGFGGIDVTKGEAETITAFFVTYLGILLLSTLSIIWLEGTGLTDSMFEVASAEGTVGLSVGLTSPSLNPLSKIILSLNMWIGRLEILPVLVVLYPKIWFPGRNQ